MKVSELLSLIDKDGWVMVRQRGSHRQFHHPTKQEQSRLLANPALMCLAAL